MFKKILLSLILFASTLSATPQIVVFDWGNVLASEKRHVVVDFMCESLQMSKAQFEHANLRKKKAMKEGKEELAFWLGVAKKKGIHLSKDWVQSYHETIKKSLGTNDEMFAIIKELKDQQIRVGLLSNITERYGKLIRSHGFTTISILVCCRSKLVTTNLIRGLMRLFFAK